MVIVKHKSLKALQNSAAHYKIEVYETGVCWSFRIFENRQTKEFHVFYKPVRQSDWLKFDHNGNVRNHYVPSSKIKIYTLK